MRPYPTPAKASGASRGQNRTNSSWSTEPEVVMATAGPPALRMQMTTPARALRGGFARIFCHQLRRNRYCLLCAGARASTRQAPPPQRVGGKAWRTVGKPESFSKLPACPAPVCLYRRSSVLQAGFGAKTRPGPAEPSREPSEVRYGDNMCLKKMLFT